MVEVGLSRGSSHILLFILLLFLAGSCCLAQRFDMHQGVHRDK